MASVRQCNIFLIILVSSMPSINSTRCDHLFIYGISERSVNHSPSKTIEINSNTLESCAEQCVMMQGCVSFDLRCDDLRCECWLFSHYLLYNETLKANGTYGYLKSPDRGKIFYIDIKQLEIISKEDSGHLIGDTLDNACMKSFWNQSYPSYPLPVLGIVLDLSNAQNYIIKPACAPDQDPKGQRECDVDKGLWTEPWKMACQQNFIPSLARMSN